MPTILDLIRPKMERIRWCPWRKVVIDHRTDSIDLNRTNMARKARGLPVPWTPEMGDAEAGEEPID